MAKRRLKARASSTTSGPSNHGTTNPSQEVVTVPGPTTVNGEGGNDEVANVCMGSGEFASKEEEIENEDILTSMEGTEEEVPMLKSEEAAFGEAAIDKEESEMAAVEGQFEEYGCYEPNSAEEGGDYSEEEDGEEEGDEDDAEGEEEDEEEEGEQMETADGEAGEQEEEEEGNVEEALLLVNTNEKKEVKADGEAQKLIVESKLKKVVAEVEKPTPSKKLVAATAGDKPGASSKKRLATMEKDKPKVLCKQKMVSTEEGKPKASGKQKVASASEDKPDAAGKQKAASSAEDKTKASGKQKVASAAGDKLKALTKEKVPAATEDKPEASSKKKSDTKAEDKPEASGKKKNSKRAESMGLIFMCNSKTKTDCYRYQVLGLPASKKDIVQKVYKGMRLFLFDIDKRLMYGIYKAAGPGGYDIQPKAFGSAFPSQVRFTVLEDCLPLAEEKFKPIIKDNYFAKRKFDCQLSSEQVKSLCKLFSTSGSVSRLKKPKHVAGGETHPDADRARVERPRVDRERPIPGRNKRKRLDEERVDKERRGLGRIRRPRLDEESRIRRPRLDEESRIRRQIRDEERVDRERLRRQREDEERLDRERVRRHKLEEESWDPRYHHDHRPVVYERERYASPLPPPSRAYDPYLRNAETAMYMRDPVLDHRSHLPQAVDHHDRQISGLDRVVVSDPYAFSYRDYDTPSRVQAAAYPPLASSAAEYHLQPVASSASQYHLQPVASSASERRLPEAASRYDYARLPEAAPRYDYAPHRPLHRY